MMDRGRLVAYLNDLLAVREFDEAAINGLQVSGSKRVNKVAFAVDGVMETFRIAVERGADMMIVHHGIYWGFQWALRGPDYQRVKLLMDANMALYAAHLPMDAHREVGHASNLLRSLGVEEESLEPFGHIKGQTVGFMGRLPESTREGLTSTLEESLQGPVQLLPFGPDKVRRLACVTGQGADFGLVREAKIKGIHYYISGEANHPIYHFARENGINLALGGHYRTEVFGLRALMQRLRSEFGLDCFLIDVPTGM